MTGAKRILFCFRRDLRLDDNRALAASLHEAQTSGLGVQCCFVFDQAILKQLPDRRDPRVTFIWSELQKLQDDLREKGSDLWVYHGDPVTILRGEIERGDVQSLYINEDYEPDALRRDEQLKVLCERQQVAFHSMKDQVIFAKQDVLTDAGRPYTVFTPYKKKWLTQVRDKDLKSLRSNDPRADRLFLQKRANFEIPSLSTLGFRKNNFVPIPGREISRRVLQNYSLERDFPAMDGTSHLGLHLRFGTVSVRELVRQAQAQNSDVWLSELIWREFFMQVLFHFPHTETRSFRPEFDKVPWRESESDWQRWSEGQTGFPLVDAGMRELNETGYMHNRVRMLVASFLTKHLLMHWKKGERYFAGKLLDFDLSANVGNWQWAAGSGCDAAPYFRIFNPDIQVKKFDAPLTYVKKWIPEYGTDRYAKPMFSHSFARDRALKAFVQTFKGTRGGTVE